MIFKRLNPIGCVLLSAVLATATTAPPALQHLHADGDVPHDHDSIAADDHDHAGGLPHHHSPADEDATQANGSTTHRHCYLLGWEITLPTSDELPAHNPIEQKQQVLGSGAISSLTVEAQSPSPLNGWISAYSFSLSPASLVCRVTKQAETATPRGFLCDTARHERSGVQLI